MKWHTENQIYQHEEKGGGKGREKKGYEMITLDKDLFSHSFILL